MEKTTAACHSGGGGGSDDPDPFLLLLLLLHLPEDSLIQILVRVPVASLLRFKSVCKSWRDLIQTSFFIDLHTTFNSSSSKFGTFILRTDNLSSENVILMLSEYEGSEYKGSKYGDGYRCTDGSWHKITTDDGDDDGSRHKFTGGDGGDWHWDNTNYWYWNNAYGCWYWVSDGGGGGGHWPGGGYWYWDNAYGRWYWVSDGRCHGGDWHWDNTNYGWSWVSDGDGGNWHWDNTNCGWYWVSDDQDEEVFKGVGDDKDDVFKVDGDDDDDDDDQLLLKVDKLELPSWYKLTYSNAIAGSCNGLVCLHDQKLRDVFLWNPATTQFRILPKCITIEIDDDFVQCDVDFVAFGFDVKTKDYKVLLITTYFTPYDGRSQTWSQKFYSRVQVYTLSTDSWRLINSPLALPAAEFNGLYMNGSCFFLANVFHHESNTRSRLINSFDFTKEIFTTMQLPDHDHRQHLYLRCFGGGEKLALFTTLRKTSSGEYEDHNDDYDGYEDCDIWVLNEHSGGSVNNESWTKLHSFQIKNSRDGIPMGISNNGKFAFLETTEGSYARRIQLYNLVTKEVKLDIPFCVCMSKVYVYKPSLVSILGGNGCSNINRVIP